MNTWNEENKQYWINTMTEHREADRLIRGDWFDYDTKRGCFFGCAMQTDDEPLEKAITAMGLPKWLIRLAEKIYEGLPDDEYLDFPVTLLQSIPTGVDLTPVMHRTAVMRLTPLAHHDPSVIQPIIDLHNEQVPIGDSRWSAVRSARSAAARSAAGLARSAAESAAGLAVRSARSAGLAVRSARSAGLAVRSVRSARSAAARSAWSAAWSVEAKNLVEVLNDTTV